MGFDSPGLEPYVLGWRRPPFPGSATPRVSVYLTGILSSTKLLFRQELFHQYSFYIKDFFRQSSFYWRNFFTSIQQFLRSNHSFVNPGPFQIESAWYLQDRDGVYGDPVMEVADRNPFYNFKTSLMR